MSSLYEHIPHPHVHARAAAGPVKVADQHDTGNAAARVNTKIALFVTKVVGSMWCAYVFGLMDLFSLPSAVRGGTGTLISWIAQTFLQLVLLSIIMVGQNVQADAADKRAEATYHDVTVLLHEYAQVQAHLVAQDVLLTKMAEKLGLDPVPVIDLPEGIDPQPVQDTVESRGTGRPQAGDVPAPPAA
ncbi:MAG TPA: hypothetical protein VH372_23480 [Actinospica sp.]|jgi:hypothetical protein|nr:hypothetical protein [Actinospica sp.]